ncbi:MAG TPA: ATP synthase F1 subunit delta [Ignavibacteriaceae bacterium]|nr:ATP synthase F1 subunit delta [Ignavibacteriaceae bacterium]
MKINFKISHRYAVSLLESVIEKKKTEKVILDIQLIVNTLQSSNELQVALQSPVIKTEIKEKIIVELFKSKIDNDSLEFIKFVIEKRREDFLLSIALRFLELYDEHIGVANVEIKTAFEFTKDQKESLQKRIEQILKKKARLNYKLDTDLIGGFVAQVGDTRYDASLSHQLELLKKQFLKGNISLN